MREEGFASKVEHQDLVLYLYRHGEGCQLPEYFAERILCDFNYQRIPNHHPMGMVSLLDDRWMILTHRRKGDGNTPSFHEDIGV